MNMTKCEKGYSLLLSLTVLIIFSILGLSLITLTSNSILKNEIREDRTQAMDISDKGIEFMSSAIQKELEDYIQTGTVGRADFQNKLTQIIQNSKYSCVRGGVEIPSETGQTKVCIDTSKIENVYNEKNELQELKKIIPIISTGIVDGKENVATAKVMVGTDAIPDQLRYAISTNNGGNLYLHGGVEVQGDIKSDGNIILSKQATWFSGTTAKWEDSVSTRIRQATSSVTPKVILNEQNNIYILKTTNKPSYDDHIAGTKLNNTANYSRFSPTATNASTTISGEFFNSPQLNVVTKDLSDDKVEISSEILEKANTGTNKKYTSLSITTANHETSKFAKNYETLIAGETEKCVSYFLIWCTKYEKTLSKSSLTINGASIYGNRSIALSGTYYVYGDISITNTNLRTNALIYVDGNVTIRESTLNGITDNSTLIIFATGEINISNISVDSDTPSVIKGFFYTKSNMIMYGVGSHIQLQGGISANRLILTAVRGSSKNNTFESGTAQALLYDHDRNANTPSIPQKNSRLTVIYDQNLISEYTDFKRDKEEEFITEINDPEIIDRSH
ncbi:type II secretion system protein [Lysinibacillus fusiformis]|nr:type II secretion system protein [Lysinibacillus fusiformis]